MTMTITLTARELTALVSPVIPHADHSGMLPVLCGVLIRSHGPWVTALATDRYRLAAQRVKPGTVPDAGFEALIPLGILARIRTTFKGDRKHAPTITLAVDGDVLRVTAADALFGLVAASFDFLLPDKPGGFPSGITRILSDALKATPTQVAQPLVVSPAYLADFEIGQPQHEPAYITDVSTEKTPMSLIRVGDNFVGVLVGVKGGPVPGDSDVWLDLLGSPATKTEAAA